MSQQNTNAALNSLLQLLQGGTVTCSNNAAINAIVSLIQAASGEPAQLGNWVFVSSASDFPSPVLGVITLEADTTYVITGHIDLNGARLVTSGSTTLVGGSSETSSITSTGLVGTLITSAYTLAMQYLTVKDVATAISINSESATIDWTGVNFENVASVGIVDNCANFVFSKGAFLNSKGLVFKTSVQTIAFDNSLFTASSGTIIEIQSSCTVSRRFRVIYSAFVVTGTAVAINVDAAASVPTESFILDTVNFSGGSTYLGGLNHTSNDSLFVNCTGITNTAVNGQLYMQANVTPTVIAVQNVYYKVAGTTAASADNSKYTHSDNRLTNEAVIARKYFIICTLSFNSGNNDVCEFGFYDSKLGGIRLPSRVKSTANNVGRAENVTFMCVVQHSIGDYLEIWAMNTSAANNITVTSMNFVITEIK